MATGIQKAASISVRIEGYATIEGVIIEDLGAFAFTRQSEAGRLDAIVNIYVKGNARVISIESDTIIMNSTKYDLKIASEGLPEITVFANTSKSLPINYLKKDSPLALLSSMNKTVLDKPKTIQYNDTEYVTYCRHSLKAVSLDGKGTA
jgi:hypothetical protein